MATKLLTLLLLPLPLQLMLLHLQLLLLTLQLLLPTTLLLLLQILLLLLQTLQLPQLLLPLLLLTPQLLLPLLLQNNIFTVRKAGYGLYPAFLFFRRPLPFFASFIRYIIFRTHTNHPATRYAQSVRPFS